jgi:hypothetical protein
LTRTARRNPALRQDDFIHDPRRHLGYIGNPMAIEAKAFDNLTVDARVGEERYRGIVSRGQMTSARSASAANASAASAKSPGPVCGSDLRREQGQAVDCRIVASIVGNEGDSVMEGTRRNPGVGRLNRTPFSLRGARDLGPPGAQFAADWQDSVPRQVLG